MANQETKRAKRLTYRQKRERRERRAGLAMLAMVAVAFGLMLAGAYYTDNSRGISAAQSLASAGL